MTKSDVFIKKHPTMDLWDINISRVKVGTIRKRDNHYWVHMPSMNVGGKYYAEINYRPVDLASAYAIANNTWRNERAELKFEIIKDSLPFTKPTKPRIPMPKGKTKNFGDFARTKNRTRRIK